LFYNNLIFTQITFTALNVKTQENFPNLFNPVTRIVYEVKEEGFVSLKVFDVLGREIKTLVEESKFPGKYAVHFNAFDLSSGIYFYKLNVSNNGIIHFNDMKKMILLR